MEEFYFQYQFRQDHKEVKLLLLGDASADDDLKKLSIVYDSVEIDSCSSR